MNTKTLLEKSKEQHKRMTREMLMYVRCQLRLNTIADEYDKCLHDCDYLKRRLCSDDLAVGELLINSGVTFDEVTERIEDLNKNDYVCPLG